MKQINQTKSMTRRGQQTRQRILQTAAALIYQNGYHATSVDDVLAASKTGKSQFYHYFKSKEQLVNDLIQYHIDHLPACQEDMLNALDSLAGIEKWLQQILEDYRSGLYSGGCPLANLANELANSIGETGRGPLVHIFSLWEESLNKGLRTMRAKGVIRMDSDPQGLSMYIVAAVEGALLLAKARRSEKPLRITVEQMSKHIRSLSHSNTRTGAVAAKKTIHPFFCP